MHLVYPSICECLKIVNKIIQQREDLYDYLELQRKVLEAQLEVYVALNEGGGDWGDQLSISFLEQRSLKTKKPMMHFLNPAILNEDSLLAIFRKVVDILIFIYPNEKGLGELRNYINTGKIDFMKLIKAALREDEEPIINCVEDFKVEPSFLLFLMNTSIQPFVQEITRKVSPSFYDRWWQAHCPVCGKIPSVARIRDKRRYLMCSFCGAEYLSDYILCVNCGNKDPHTLNFIKLEQTPEFQIDFCIKCKHYLKVINERKIKEPIPRFVEDLLTLDLDIKAKQLGLIRT